MTFDPYLPSGTIRRVLHGIGTRKKRGKASVCAFWSASGGSKPVTSVWRVVKDTGRYERLGLANAWLPTMCTHFEPRQFRIA